MIQIYCGDGKGKTTAAVGLAIRAAGRDMRVVFAQFLKGGDSGERVILAGLPSVTLLAVPDQIKFSFTMDEAEKAQETERENMLFHNAAACSEGADLLVLDELCAALTTGMVPLQEAVTFLDSLPEGLEVVITGRNPPQPLLDRADYITEMKKERHPFDKGVRARKGIER